jgi:hypothetical protein
MKSSLEEDEFMLFEKNFFYLVTFKDNEMLDRNKLEFSNARVIIFFNTELHYICVF